MLSINANNALSAKAHAKYGKMLKDKDYRELLACQSVGEVADYLRTNTHYSDIFEKFGGTDVHRGMLEELLRRKAFDETVSLCRYELSGRYKLFPVIAASIEIEQILHCLRLFKSGRVQEYLFILPDFFNKHTVKLCINQQNTL